MVIDLPAGGHDMHASEKQTRTQPVEDAQRSVERPFILLNACDVQGDDQSHFHSCTQSRFCNKHWTGQVSNRTDLKSVFWTTNPGGGGLFSAIRRAGIRANSRFLHPHCSHLLNRQENGRPSQQWFHSGMSRASFFFLKRGVSDNKEAEKSTKVRTFVIFLSSLLVVKTFWYSARFIHGAARRSAAFYSLSVDNFFCQEAFIQMTHNSLKSHLFFPLQMEKAWKPLWIEDDKGVRLTLCMITRSILLASLRRRTSCLSGSTNLNTTCWRRRRRHRRWCLRTAAERCCSAAAAVTVTVTVTVTPCCFPAESSPLSRRPPPQEAPPPTRKQTSHRRRSSTSLLVSSSLELSSSRF